MDDPTTQGRHDARRWLVLAGVLVLVLAVGIGAFALTRPETAAPVPTAPVTTPPASVPATSPAATPSPTPEVTESMSPTPTPTPTPKPSPSEDSRLAAYCKAFAKIESGGIDAQAGGDGVDFDQLGKTFDTLISRYSAASKVAPAKLQEDYARVLGYLRQGRSAVKSKDLGNLKAMLDSLASLNDTMSRIQKESRAIC